MRGFNYRWVFLLLIILGATSTASAAQYFYTSKGAASEACTADNVSGNFANPRCDVNETSKFYKLVNFANGQGYNWYYWTGCPEGQTATGSGGVCETPPVPGGDECGSTVFAGSTYPMITKEGGECVSILNADIPSQCKYLSKSTRTGYTYISFDTNGVPQPPPPVSQGGCEATVIDYSHCKPPAPSASAGGISLGPAPAKCRVGLNFSGAATGATPPAFVPASSNDPGVCIPGEDCTPGDPPITSNSKPCTYTLDGEGRKVCDSSKYTGQPGNFTSCGSVNGQWQCIGKKPSSNGISITTTVSDTTNPDGTTTTTKLDTHTNTVCTGVGSCTSTVTKNTTVTVKNGNGDTLSQSGSCSGAACSTTGAGGKGDSDGDGLSDCAAAGTCEEEEGTGAQDWYETGDDTYASVIEGFGDRVAGVPAVAGVANFLTFTPSGACPVYTVDAWVFNIRLDQWCDGSTIPWELIKAIVIACCAFLAFRIAFL